jgi:hypoxanthine phosphoribosyltransferase
MIRTLIDASTIAARLGELALEIDRDYADRDLTLVCVLKGSMPFFVDLARALQLPVSFEYVSVRSYFDGEASSGRVELVADLDSDIEGRHVLLIEDIVDTGRTIHWLREHLSRRRPASLRVAALLDKPSRRVVPVEIDYTGFVIGDVFVVGYGLDWSQRYRNLPFIGVLEKSSTPDPEGSE